MHSHKAVRVVVVGVRARPLWFLGARAVYRKGAWARTGAQKGLVVKWPRGRLRFVPVEKTAKAIFTKKQRAKEEGACPVVLSFFWVMFLSVVERCCSMALW